MGTAFWIRRFLLVFASALVIIAGVQMLKGAHWATLSRRDCSGRRSHRVFLPVRAFISRAEATALRYLPRHT